MNCCPQRRGWKLIIWDLMWIFFLKKTSILAIYSFFSLIIILQNLFPNKLALAVTKLTFDTIFFFVIHVENINWIKNALGLCRFPVASFFLVNLYHLVHSTWLVRKALQNMSILRGQGSLGYSWVSTHYTFFSQNFSGLLNPQQLRVPESWKCLFGTDFPS